MRLVARISSDQVSSRTDVTMSSYEGFKFTTPPSPPHDPRRPDPAPPPPPRPPPRGGDRRPSLLKTTHTPKRHTCKQTILRDTTLEGAEAIFSFVSSIIAIMSKAIA